MFRAVANHPGETIRRPVAIYTRRSLKISWSIRPDAGMIVVEDEDTIVVVVPDAADARVTRTQVAVLYICLRVARRLFTDNIAVPWPVLTMRRNDDPFLAQRMPSFFPFDHATTAFSCE